MRKTFIKKLIEIAYKDPDIYLMTGDLGFSVLESFREEFPDRFINAGIAEQNMIGVAAGLAMTGKKVFVYSIVPFITMRCFEQIRIDLCYQNLPVRLVGVGGGVMYGCAATTHHALEDIAIIRSLPNMTIISPANNYETENLLEQANDLPGPVYFRLTKGNENILYDKKNNIKLGKMIEILPNDEHIIFITGDILSLGFDVCEKLKKIGINVGLVSVPTIKPLDINFLLSKKNKLRSFFVIEEHNVIGGLGEALSSFICQNFDRNIYCKLFGISDFYFHEVGSRDYLRKKVGLSVDNIYENVLKTLILLKKDFLENKNIKFENL